MNESHPEFPVVTFSRWVPWAMRETLRDIDTSGVYLISHFQEAPDNQADPLAQEIVYIGETHGQTLRIRWCQFCISASTGRTGHSGGRTYFRKYCGIRSDLHVAACLVQKAYTVQVESRLIREYRDRWERRPVCNSK